jgi:aminopeptidase YwaD
LKTLSQIALCLLLVLSVFFLIHVSNEEAGIPVVFLNYHTDPNYHTDADTLDKISKDNLYKMGTLATILTYNLANDKKLPVPSVAAGQPMKAQSKPTASYQEMDVK